MDSNRIVHVILGIAIAVVGLSLVWVCLKTQENAKAIEELKSV